MRKLFLFLTLLCIGFSLIACDGNSSDTTETPTQDIPTNEYPDQPDPTVPGGNGGGDNGGNNGTVVPTPATPVVDDIVPDSTITDKLMYVDIEIGETYNISSLLNEFSSMTLSFEDESLASFEGGVITGLNKGVTKVTLKHNNLEQVVRLEVHEKGALGSVFTFDKYRLTGKNIVAFGDSVTDYVTNNADSYYERFAQAFGMNAVKNYAIGGTTGHYGYAGSNLYNEYFWGGDWITDGAGRKVVDGPQRVKNAFNELANIDYVFIAYTHNDQHFQPLPTHDGYNNYDLNSFDSCASFKGSYVYMIETLRLANPDVRIILMAPTYAQYDITNIAHNGDKYYGKEYNYSDYRQMIKEVADEKNVMYVNSWNYLKDFYDYDVTTKTGQYTYYKDPVHMNANGQQVLADYLVNRMSPWYLNGAFAISNQDADYQFAKSSNIRFKLNLTVTSRELNTPFVISNGTDKLDASNMDTIPGSVKVNSDNSLTFLEEGEYVIEINSRTNKVTIAKISNPVIYYTRFDSSMTTCKTYKVEMNSNGLYEFETNIKMWGTIQINYHGEYLSCERTTFKGEFGAYGGSSSTKLYAIENTTTTFVCSNSAGGTYKFVYNPKTNELNISVNSGQEDNSGFVYSGTQSGTVKADSNGKYVFEVDLPIWGNVSMSYNGIAISSSLVTVTGDFSTSGALWNNKLYQEGNDTVFYCCIGENGNPSVTNHYKFTYDPVAKTLHIEHVDKAVSQDGLEVVKVQNITSYDVVEANGVYTITVTANGSNYPGIRLYYNGTELTPSNTTPSGSGYYADWGSLNNGGKVGLYYQPDDGQSVPGWFSISSGTFVIVYDSAANTLNIQVK